MEARGHLAGVTCSSICVAQRLGSSDKDWLQAPLPAEPPTKHLHFTALSYFQMNRSQRKIKIINTQMGKRQAFKFSLTVSQNSILNFNIKIKIIINFIHI